MRWRRPRRELDVVVVGAGFSGLAAASALVETGLEVVVLEAQDRVGGRTWTVEADGTWIELGGMWTGPGQPRLAALLEEHGLATFPQPEEGVALLASGGAVGPDRAQLWEDVAEHVAALDDLGRGVPPDAPWTATDAAVLDGTTLDAWLVANVPDAEVARTLEVLLTELMCVPARELSLLTLLHAGVTSGTLAAALGTEGGAQERRVVGGLQGAALAMASVLGDRVRLGAAVERLSWNSDGAIVDLAAGSLMARDVVLAVAPSGCESIDFEPVLPVRRTESQRRMPLGDVVKIVTVYDRPFWRDAGLSGSVLDLDGPFGHCVDASSPDSPRGVLVSFLAGDAARRLGDRALGERASQARQDAWVARAVAWFGDEAAALRHYRDVDWSAVPSIGGGYSGVMLPGAWAGSGPGLVAPVGCLHWAGSEAAVAWTGYVEGALQAGHRAAAEVLDARRAR